ncbi:hypothetical protein M422DRAFT_161957, partial [Sphaerobolus stellatus SS14]
LPPGPPQRLFMGNTLDMPKERQWETFAKGAQQYGEIVYLRLVNTDMIIVNSRQMTYELFDKRSSIYSDRPDFPMVKDVMGWDWGLPFQRYGLWWRAHRRTLHAKFHVNAVDAFKPSQLKHTRYTIFINKQVTP